MHWYLCYLILVSNFLHTYTHTHIFSSLFYNLSFVEFYICFILLVRIGIGSSNSISSSSSGGIRSNNTSFNRSRRLSSEQKFAFVWFLVSVVKFFHLNRILRSLTVVDRFVCVFLFCKCLLLYQIGSDRWRDSGNTEAHLHRKSATNGCDS